MHGNYTFSPDTVYFRFYCPPYALCAAPPLGIVLSTGDLVVVPSISGVTEESKYVRVR